MNRAGSTSLPPAPALRGKGSASVRALLLAAASALPLAALVGCSAPIAPESEVAGALHRYSQGQAPAFDAGGVEVRVERVQFARVLVKPEGNGYTAVATVDAEARIPGGPAISYLGVERIPFVFEGRRPRPRDALLPALAQLVQVLRRKSEALAAGAPDALGPLLAERWEDPSLKRDALLAAVRERGPVPQPPPARWIVRVEREGAEVLEEGAPQDGGRSPRTRFRLVKERGGFRFSSGLR